MSTKARSLFDTAILQRALVDSLKKLDPRRQIRNPVMFTVYVGSILTTGLWLYSLQSAGEEPSWFIFAVSVWLWFTVLFANFAEAMAEGRGKAQADALRRARQQVPAKKILRDRSNPDSPPSSFADVPRLAPAPAPAQTSARRPGAPCQPARRQTTAYP